MFSCEFCKILKSSFFYKATPVEASVFLLKKMIYFGNQNKIVKEKIATSRGVFRTLHNNFNAAFLWKYYGVQVDNYFSKKAPS